MHSRVFELKDSMTTPNVTEAPNGLWRDCYADYYGLIDDASCAKNYFSNYDANSNAVTFTFDDVLNHCKQIKQNVLKSLNSAIEHISSTQISTLVSNDTKYMLNTIYSNDYRDSFGARIIYNDEYYTINEFHIMLMQEYISTGNKQSHTFYIGSVWDFHF